MESVNDGIVRVEMHEGMIAALWLGHQRLPFVRIEASVARWHAMNRAYEISPPGPVRVVAE